MAGFQVITEALEPKLRPYIQAEYETSEDFKMGRASSCLYGLQSRAKNPVDWYEQGV